MHQVCACDSLSIHCYGFTEGHDRVSERSEEDKQR